MAVIKSNYAIAEGIYLMEVAWQGEVRPGQFFMLRAWERDPLLSRPISVCDYDEESGTLTFLYMVKGQGTRLMSRLGPMDAITLDGPHGNGFPEIKSNLVAVGGGIGIAPLLYTIKDFKRKVAKAATKDGPCFIHVMSPCPSGWKFPTDQTIQIAKKAIKSGMWLLWEREGGKITINRKPTDFDAIPEYLHSQHRFDRLTDELTERIINDAKARYDTLLKLSEIDIV